MILPPDARSRPLRSCRPDQGRFQIGQQATAAECDTAIAFDQGAARGGPALVSEPATRLAPNPPVVANPSRVPKLTTLAAVSIAATATRPSTRRWCQPRSR